MSDLSSLYTNRKNTFEQQARTLEQKEILTSWARVGLIVLVLLTTYFSFNLALIWWIVILLLIGFVYLVKHHEQLKAQLKILQNLVNINAWEVKSQNGDHSNFEDGREFVDSHHPYSFDLDIFGEGSLFQRINRTSTEPGKEKLAYQLANPLTSVDAIIAKQSAVKEVAEKLEFRQNFQAIGLSAPEKKKDQQQILDWLSLPSFVYGKSSFRWMLIVFPLLALFTLLIWIFLSVSAPFIIVTLIQWAIIGSHAKRVTLLQDYIGNKRYLLEKFADHFDLLNKENFRTEITRELNHEGHEAREELLVLASRSRALNLRLNLFAILLLNSTILYDLQCVYKLEQWREKNRDRLAKWLSAIAETDALNSLGSYAFNHPDFSVPEMLHNNELIATELGHPLINVEHRVCNDLHIQKESNIWIVTGANMAGKSTFLRTVGVNVILAHIGSVVCAKKMMCPLTEVRSGMRNTDSINENQSYFFAELLRLQTIIQKLREGKSLLILLDEILKGTNSVDKLAGSEELIKQLASHSCLALVATHDVALADLEKTFDRVRNFHFETFIKGDELSFDYKLKPGVSTGKNATFLMRKMGIIPASSSVS